MAGVISTLWKTYVHTSNKKVISQHNILLTFKLHYFKELIALRIIWHSEISGDVYLNGNSLMSWSIAYVMTVFHSLLSGQYLLRPSGLLASFLSCQDITQGFSFHLFNQSWDGNIRGTVWVTISQLVISGVCFAGSAILSAHFQNSLHHVCIDLGPFWG